VADVGLGQRPAVARPCPQLALSIRVSAYIRSINRIIGENDVMNAETLPKVQMPNRDNFIRDPSKI